MKKKSINILREKIKDFNNKLIILEELLNFVPDDFADLEDEIYFSSFLDDINKSLIKDLTIELIEQINNVDSKKDVIKALQQKIESEDFEKVMFEFEKT